MDIEFSKDGTYIVTWWQHPVVPRIGEQVTLIYPKTEWRITGRVVKVAYTIHKVEVEIN